MGPRSHRWGVAQDQTQSGPTPQSEFLLTVYSALWVMIQIRKATTATCLTPCLELTGLPKSQKRRLQNVRWE